MHAMSTVPDCLEIFESSIPSAGSGVFAKELIEAGAYFGPYKGVKVSRNVDKKLIDTSYMWEVSWFSICIFIMFGFLLTPIRLDLHIYTFTLF